MQKVGLWIMSYNENSQFEDENSSEYNDTFCHLKITRITRWPERSIFPPSPLNLSRFVSESESKVRVHTQKRLQMHEMTPLSHPLLTWFRHSLAWMKYKWPLIYVPWLESEMTLNVDGLCLDILTHCWLISIIFKLLSDLNYIILLLLASIHFLRASMAFSNTHFFLLYIL